VQTKVSEIQSYFYSCDSLYKQLNLQRVPKHIAIIMDGNGRWAKQRGFMRIRGHEHARTSVRECVKTCGELGVKALSLFAFSTENWSRPKEEVDFLFKLFQMTLEQEGDELNKSSVFLRVSGDRTQLPDWLNKTLDSSIKNLSGNHGLVLNLAVNYGGKQDILQAVNKVISVGSKITEGEFEKALYTNGLPDVDLLIRTSGELRISNFFLWQAAYAELYFTPVLWPDFRREHLLEAILDFQKRNRRFGAI